MNKSKFKAVRFKPFDLELHYQTDGAGKEVWTNYFAFGHSLMNNVYFTDSCIKAYPELFEVEKAEREFKDGAWYRAKYSRAHEWEVVRFCEGYGFMRVGLMGYKPRQSFFEIGEKIEL